MISTLLLWIDQRKLVKRWYQIAQILLSHFRRLLILLLVACLSHYACPLLTIFLLGWIPTHHAFPTTRDCLRGMKPITLICRSVLSLFKIGAHQAHCLIYKYRRQFRTKTSRFQENRPWVKTAIPSSRCYGNSDLDKVHHTRNVGPAIPRKRMHGYQSPVLCFSALWSIFKIGISHYWKLRSSHIKVKINE